MQLTLGECDNRHVSQAVDSLQEASAEIPQLLFGPAHPLCLEFQAQYVSSVASSMNF